MPTERQTSDGQWLPAEPLEGTFGLRWEMAWRFRRSIGHGWVRSIVGGWRDARAVDSVAALGQEQSQRQGDT